MRAGSRFGEEYARPSEWTDCSDSIGAAALAAAVEYLYDLTGYEYFNRGVSDGDVLTKMKQHGVEGWELAAIVPEMHEDKQGHRQYTATLIYKRPM